MLHLAFLANRRTRGCLAKHRTKTEGRGKQLTSLAISKEKRIHVQQLQVCLIYQVMKTA